VDVERPLASTEVNPENRIGENTRDISGDDAGDIGSQVGAD
jgi:hypothetical protein